VSGSLCLAEQGCEFAARTQCELGTRKARSTIHSPGGDGLEFRTFRFRAVPFWKRAPSSSGGEIAPFFTTIGRAGKSDGQKQALLPYLIFTDRGGCFRYCADWSDVGHHYRQLASELIGIFGCVHARRVAPPSCMPTHPAMSPGMTLALSRHMQDSVSATAIPESLAWLCIHLAWYRIER